MADTLKSALTRRDFGLGIAAAGVGMAAANAIPSPASAKMPNVGPGVKLGLELTLHARTPPPPSAELLLFLKQIDCHYVTNYFIAKELLTLENLMKWKQAYADAGVTLYSVGSPGFHILPPEIQYNLPGRDKKIEEFKAWLGLAGKVGIPYMLSAMIGPGIWSGKDIQVREGGMREFNEAGPLSIGGKSNLKITDRVLDREYSYNEMFDNFTYLCKQIGPAAEDAGVCVGFHTPDPPGYPVQGGVAQIMYDFESIKKAMAATGSPNLGFSMDTGIWAEGGTKMGASLTDAIRYFVGEQKKVMEMHFRNVSGPIPRFNEAYLDNGVLDMYEPMKALVEAGYTGIAHNDHTPKGWVGNPYSFYAYDFSYRKALLQRAERERKK